MKHYLLTFLLFLFSNQIFAQTSENEKILKTETKEVTVYLQGSQIFRTGDIN